MLTPRRAAATDVPRAERLALQSAVTYRIAGDDHWLQGRVANLSESGMLFGPTDLTPGTRVELIIVSPISLKSMAPGRLVCVAEVVRTTEAGVTAARFEACRFLIES
jgi:hypothetical protein